MFCTTDLVFYSEDGVGDDTVQEKSPVDKIKNYFTETSYQVNYFNYPDIRYAFLG